MLLDTACQDRVPAKRQMYSKPEQQEKRETWGGRNRRRRGRRGRRNDAAIENCRTGETCVYKNAQKRLAAASWVTETRKRRRRYTATFACPCQLHGRWLIGTEGGNRRERGGERQQRLKSTNLSALHVEYIDCMWCISEAAVEEHRQADWYREQLRTFMKRNFMSKFNHLEKKSKSIVSPIPLCVRL